MPIIRYNSGALGKLVRHESVEHAAANQRIWRPSSAKNYNLTMVASNVWQFFDPDDGGIIDGWRLGVTTLDQPFILGPNRR